MTPGSIVQCRNREWVLLPSDQENLLLLRPLTGATDEVVAVHKGLTDLIGYSFPEERVRSAKFPPPEESETVTQAVLQALFFRGRTAEEALPQMELGLELPEVAALHRSWDLDAAREKENRTRFAQRALKPEEVSRELDATDAVLGDPEAVRLFVLNAAQRLGIHIEPLAANKPEGRMETGDRRREQLRRLPSPVSCLPSSAYPLVLTLVPACPPPSPLLYQSPNQANGWSVLFPRRLRAPNTSAATNASLPPWLSSSWRKP